MIGEARRFDGSTAPAGWMFAQNQTLQIVQNPKLFTILRTMAGGDGKTTFKLPTSKLSWIVAVAGTFPSNPGIITHAGRRMTPADSLGDGAVPGRLRFPKPVSDATMKERRLIASAVRVGRASAMPVSRELRGRMRQAQLDARSAALEALSASNRGQLDAVVQHALAGRIRVYDAVLTMTSQLSGAEASALLEINDSMTRSFSDQWRGNAHPNPALEAGRFLLSVAITQDQIEAALTRNPTALR
ncbi:MAG TPA: phage tail protein [Candidatus Elarobacter sp.]|jgi:hypothetical protein